MRLRNTSRHDTAEVRRLVAIGMADVDTRGVCVNVKNHTVRANSYGFRGMAYQGVPLISNAPPTAQYLVTLGIGPADAFPRGPMQHTKRSAPQWFADWREALVYVAAHEAKHIEQFKEGLPCSEVRCEAFAAGALRRYRERAS